jgi:hypothetical protein
MTHPTTEAIARIIDPTTWGTIDRVREMADHWRTFPREDIQRLVVEMSGEISVLAAPSLAKAAAILTLIAPGEEFLEFKEALSDLRSLRQEHRDLNGGGPNWTARNKAAWAKVDELFANEDEAAYDRQQEDAHG